MSIIREETISLKLTFACTLVSLPLAVSVAASPAAAQEARQSAPPLTFRSPTP